MTNMTTLSGCAPGRMTGPWVAPPSLGLASRPLPTCGN